MKNEMCIACERSPCEGGKIFGERSVNPAAKRVEVGALIRERSEWALLTRPFSARPARPRLHSPISP